MDKVETRKAFGERLREVRVQRRFLSARALAAHLGIEENRYTRYERGEVEPSLHTLGLICLALEVSPNDLIPRQVWRHADGAP